MSALSAVVSACVVDTPNPWRSPVRSGRSDGSADEGLIISDRAR